MKFDYYPDTDTLYIILQDKPGADAYELSSGVVVDVDGEGKVVGIEIEHASEVTDLSNMEFSSLPTKTFTANAE